MINKLKILACACILLAAASCSRYVAPPFTDVVKISQLKPNMKVKQVIDVLGIEPYDIYYMQETGAQMLSFNYRVKKRIMYVYSTVNYLEVQRQTSNEESQKSGDLFYDKKYQTVYAMFNKDGDLMSYLTTNGINHGAGLIVNGNTIQYYDEKNINVLDSSYNRANNPFYSGKSVNIMLNRDGTFNLGGAPAPTKKWWQFWK
jgi:hypothetical protein